MKKSFWLLPALILSLTAQSHAQNVLTPEQWRADLRALATDLSTRHREPFRKASHAQFDSAVSELDAQIPRLSDHEIMVGFQRIASLLHDGHTRLTLPEDSAVFSRAHTPTDPPSNGQLYFHRLPVVFDIFSDGVFIRSTTAALSAINGAHVTRIGRMSADSALEAIRPVVNYDSPTGFLLLAPVFLANTEVLHAQHITDEPRRVHMSVVTTTGQKREIDLDALPLNSAEVMVDARARIPLAEQQPEKWYWLRYSKPTRTLYVQFRRIGSMSEEPISAFAQRMTKTFRDSAAQKLVIDLRYNDGGDNSTSRPFFFELMRNDSINRFGHLFVLMGRRTFSAAQNLVNDLAYQTQALFVGEPSGNSPNMYGDSRKYKLPQSGLTARISSVYWRNHESESDSVSMPEIPVTVASSDFLNASDVVLSAAEAFPIYRDPAELVRAVAKRSGWDAASRVCFAYSADTRLSAAAREKGFAECGFMALAEGKADLAAAWFRMNLNHIATSQLIRDGLQKAIAAGAK